MCSNFEQGRYRRTRFGRAHPYETVSCHTLQYDYLIPIKVLGAELEFFYCLIGRHFGLIRPRVLLHYISRLVSAGYLFLAIFQATDTK